MVVKLVCGAVGEDAAPSGGGGGGGAATRPESGKRKPGAAGSGKGRDPKKSKTGAPPFAATPDHVDGAVVDHGDGTYGCNCTLSEGGKNAEVRQLEVLLNIDGSQFAVEVRPSADVTNWVFGSIATDRGWCSGDQDSTFVERYHR